MNEIEKKRMSDAELVALFEDAAFKAGALVHITKASSGKERYSRYREELLGDLLFRLSMARQLSEEVSALSLAKSGLESELSNLSRELTELKSELNRFKSEHDVKGVCGHPVPQYVVQNGRVVHAQTRPCPTVAGRYGSQPDLIGQTQKPTYT